MIKNKKVLFTGAVALFGFSVYRYMKSREITLPDEIWTADNVPDLTGKVIIVTGANSGVGFEAAREFARKGAHTILACRNMQKAQAAVEKIRAEIPESRVEIMELDLEKLASVRSFSENFKSKYERLDVLLNNAGIMMVPYGLTEDGFERQFGTNHLGHFALTGLLVDLLVDTPGSRVVNISSNGHRFGKMDFENLMYENGNVYNPMDAYGRSKLANLLFTNELQRRLEAAGASTIATAAHPGLSDTNLSDHILERWHLEKIKPFIGRFLQSAADGALPSLRAAVDPNLSGGDYIGPHGPRESRGYPVLVSSSEASHNVEDAQKLWQVSEELTGIEYL